MGASNSACAPRARHDEAGLRRNHRRRWRGAMPWEGPLNAVMDSITGPTARIIAILIIVATGLTLAFGDVGQGFKKLLQILFGLAIAFAAATFFLPLVGGGGAMVP